VECGLERWEPSLRNSSSKLLQLLGEVTAAFGA